MSPGRPAAPKIAKPLPAVRAERHGEPKTGDEKNGKPAARYNQAESDSPTCTAVFVEDVVS